MKNNKQKLFEMMNKVNPSFIKEDIFYRVDFGYRHNSDVTAKDVVDFEADENGNEDFRTQANEKGIDLSKYPAKNIMWVTKTENDAKRYGDDVSQIKIDNYIILAEDGDEGYLVLNLNK